MYEIYNILIFTVSSDSRDICLFAANDYCLYLIPRKRFGLVYWHINLSRLFIAKAIFLEEQ